MNDFCLKAGRVQKGTFAPPKPKITSCVRFLGVSSYYLTMQQNYPLFISSKIEYISSKLSALTSFSRY